MDATGCPGPAQAAPAGCAPSCAAATALLGIPGLVVRSVTVTGDGWTVADVITDPAAEAARCCPKCGATATRVKERPRTAPRDVLIGDRQILLRWGKMSAVATARRYGVSDRTAARAFDAYASQQLAGLDDEQDLGEAAGIDEFRRGAPAHGTDPETGEPVQTRSQWLTHLVDLGTGGSIGLAEGRTAAAEKDLLAAHAGRLRYLAMDLSATYRSGAPAGITLIADAFHLVKLANKKIDEAFRRLGYRTGHPHEELGLPRPLHYMLRYNIENLAPDCLDTIITVLDSDADGQQIAAVWIAKEHLRDLLALRATRTRVTPAPSAVRDKLASFYIWCADHHDIPEIATLAKTIGKWQQPVIDAVLTGYSNAKAEAHNRTAKLVARNARGFANSGNQARRVRMATTRTARQARRGNTRRLSRTVARVQTLARAP